MIRIVLLCTMLCLLTIGSWAQTPRPTGGATAPPAAAQPTGGTGVEGKIAVINSSAFGAGVAELKAKIETFNAEFDPKRKELEGDQKEYDRLKGDIQTKGGTVTAQVRDQWVEQAQDYEKKIKRKSEDFQQQAEKRYAEITQPVSMKIVDAISKYATTHGIVLVMDVVAAQQQQLLVHITPTMDITDDFIKEYNKSNPATAAPAPPAKK